MKRTNTGTAKNPINLDADTTAPRGKRTRSKVPENVVDLEEGERRRHHRPNPTALILDSATSPKSYEASLRSSIENKLIEKLGKLNLNVEQTKLKRAASRSPPQDSETRPPIKRAAPTKVLPENMQPRIADASSSGSEEPSSSSPRSSSQREPVPPRNQASRKGQAPPKNQADAVPIQIALTRGKQQAAPKRQAEEVPIPPAQRRVLRNQPTKRVNYVENPGSSSEKETSNSSDENNSYYSSSRSSSSSSSLPGNREQNVQVDIKYDINELKFLNALDSYHDFTGQRAKKVNGFDISLVNKVINHFISEEIKKKFNKVILNKTHFEDDIFKEYVKNNLNIKIKETTGGAGESKRVKKEENSNIFLDILNHYNITQKEDASKLAIILDHGGACRKYFEEKYVASYASWFDNSISDSFKYCNTNNIKLKRNITVSKKENDLFYIDEISGGPGIKGHIKFNNDATEIPFSKPEQSGCRPEVRKYAGYIKNIENIKTIKDIQDLLFDKKEEETKEKTKVKQENAEKWFTEQISKIYSSETNPTNAVYNSCMFLMDLKRSGDGMQIQSAIVMDNNNDRKPIFMTHDRMAAVISAFKGVRTIFTKKKKEQDDAKLLLLYNKQNENKRGGTSSTDLVQHKQDISDYSKTITSNIMKEYLHYVINFTDKYKMLLGAIATIIKDPDPLLLELSKNIRIAHCINSIFKDTDEEMDYFIKSPVGAIYMEYLLSIHSLDIDVINKLKKKSLHPIILNFLNYIHRGTGPILENQQHPRTVLKDLYNRTLKDHVTYMNMNTVIPIKPISGTKRSSKTIINSYTDYPYDPTKPEDLYNFMKLPFQVKHMIIQYSTDKEKIIRHVFDTFYKSDNFKIEEIDKEIAVIKHCKNILKVPLEQPIKSSDNKAFLLFREILYFQPEYIDPFMRIYMTYSNSPVPPNIAFQSIPITPQSSPVPVPVTRKSGPNIPRPPASRKLLLAGGKKK
jgi:hypothetical protein